MGQVRLALGARLRGRRGVARPADGQGPDRRALADRLGLSWANRRASRRRAAGRGAPAGTSGDRRRRDLLPAPVPLPDERRRPSLGGNRVVRSGPQLRDPEGILRCARRAQALDQGRLDRHVRRLREGDLRGDPTGRDRLRSPSTSYASPSARWTRSVATSKTRTSAPTRRRESGSRAPAGRC